MIIAYSVITFLILVVIVLIFSMVTLLHDIKAVGEDLSDILNQDTNALLTTASSNYYIKRFVSVLNEELKVILNLKREYSKGILDLKCSAENVVHDIRTPLTAIKGYVDLLEKEEISEEGGRYLEVIKGRVDYMKSLTDELFLSLSMKNRGIMEMSEIDAKSILEEALLSFYSQISEKNITPCVVLPEGKVSVKGDSKALFRVYMNIISNALKYGEGELKIEMDGKGNTVFSNPAPLMDSVDAKRLLDRYFTISDAKASSGIGLSISKEIIGDMGGELKINLNNGRLYISIVY